MKLKMAGNTNLGCVRKNNEDNYCASADLQSGLFANAASPWGAEQVVDLGPKGVLLVVADGMGGTNAGEVASERAVIKAAECFAPGRITADVTSRTDKILNFMEQTIVACDKEVKDWGNTHPESKGMGTTMVMGWILDGKLYVAWCGDSRAYVFRPSENKIYQVSKDHSYVQLLVDKEMLTREETFDHPQGNIITRSLSHGQPDARPESLPEPYELCDGDIVLLCSDGLSGMLHDEEMADIISKSPDDVEQIVNNLINGARQAGGSDNITAVLCKVENGGKGNAAASARFFAKTEAALNGPGGNGAKSKPMPLFHDEPARPAGPPQGPITMLNFGAVPTPAPVPRKSSAVKKLIPVIVVLAVLIVCGAGWLTYQKFFKPAPAPAADTEQVKEDEGQTTQDKPIEEIDESVENSTSANVEKDKNQVTQGQSSVDKVDSNSNPSDSLNTDSLTETVQNVDSSVINAFGNLFR
ncbi:MAG: protein phosphatase 2C domain-containing protein [Muribaculaceae bacterium]|nr:protein phosphatase 2C domain-containing protein [Muribaculaceae bacterium]